MEKYVHYWYTLLINYSCTLLIHILFQGLFKLVLTYSIMFLSEGVNARIVRLYVYEKKGIIFFYHLYLSFNIYFIFIFIIHIDSIKNFLIMYCKMYIINLYVLYYLKLKVLSEFSNLSISRIRYFILVFVLLILVITFPSKTRN